MSLVNINNQLTPRCTGIMKFPEKRNIRGKILPQNVENIKQHLSGEQAANTKFSTGIHQKRITCRAVGQRRPGNEKDLRLRAGNISPGSALARGEQKSPLNQFLGGTRLSLTVDPSPGLHGVPSTRVRTRLPTTRCIKAESPVCVHDGERVSVCRCNGAGSCNSSVVQPPRTRPDRHLRQLSRRRLTNWLLNYWPT